MSGGDSSFWADKAWLFGLLAAIATGAVILGGIKSIARVAEKIVPTMGVIYVLCGAIILGVNWHSLPQAFAAIWQSAFTLQAGWGGFLGALIMGVQRAAFSNEAGLGTAGIAHAPTNTHQAVSEGFIGMLGPFFDTIIICTMTALVVVVTGAYLQTDPSTTGVVLTARAFATVSPYMVWVLALCVSLFAYSTLLTYSYYGVQALNFLFGENKKVALIFNSVFLVCTVLAPMASLGAVIDITDGLIFTMAIPNIIGLYFLAPTLKRALKTYWAQYG
jgi:AGCS family alanine or glycine:cation symporter